MKTLKFSVEIKASAAKVWQVLWSDITYRKWTSAFSEGSYAETDWQQGSPVKFLSPAGEGIASVIEVCKAKEQMIFKHLHAIKNFTVQADTEESKAWSGARESYTLKEENGLTRLEVSTDTLEAYESYFAGAFPQALNMVKQLAEEKIILRVQAEILCQVDKAWRCWTEPAHIVNWNFASDDWCCPRAENDVRVDGKFVSRMEAKDGSFGFDFCGVHTLVEPGKKVESRMDDGRTMSVEFFEKGKNCLVVEQFEAEEENTLDLQQMGWQMVLDNFRRYAERA